MAEMKDVSVKAMSLDNNHNLFVATDNGFYTYADTSLSLDKHDAQNPHSIADNVVWSTMLDSRGNLVLGTDVGKGLDRIDITTLRVTNMAKSDPGCMVADKHGNIWTANADGLLCYTNSGKPLRHSYGVGQENADAVALCDVNGMIWAITNRECLVFSQNDGHGNRRLRIPIVSAYGAFFSTAERCLYIGGQDGMVELFPSEIGSRRKRRGLLLTDFYVNGEQRQVHGNTIRLCHNENNIDLRLSDLPYTGEVAKSYAYQLKGTDDRWHLIQSIGEPLVYRALPHGSYTLSIRSIETDVENGDEVYSAKIRILPPWYLSWWAKAFYLLLSVASVLWLSRFYLMRKQLAKEKRDKQLIMQLTGVSPVEYIRNIRMEKAGLLLREGKFSVSEVMYMVGFTKSGYFSKCFQEAFGMTPSAYIRNTSH